MLDSVGLAGGKGAAAGKPPVRHVRVVVHEVIHAAQEDGADRGSDGPVLAERAEAVQQRLGGQVSLVEHRPADPGHQLPFGEVDLGVVLGQPERGGQVTPGERGVKLGPRRAAQVCRHSAIVPHVAVRRERVRTELGGTTDGSEPRCADDRRHRTRA